MRFNITLILWLLLSGTAFAGDFDYDAFSKIPVQHEGRIKPLETFARVHLERFSGASHIDNTPPIAWLAQSMFDPAKAMGRPLFLVKDVDVQAMLSLPSKPNNLYAFAEITQTLAANRALIQSLLQRPAPELTARERAILDLYEEAGLFTQIVLSQTLFLHLSANFPQTQLKKFHIAKAPSAFMDFYPYMSALKQALETVLARKGANPDRYTPQELQLAQTMQTLTITMQSSENNILLRVIPPSWSRDDVWLSPWAVFHTGQGSPESAEAMALWRSLAAAYQEHDAVHWKQASLALLQKSQAIADVRPDALSVEVAYYQWAPLGKSMALYIGAFLLTLFCLTDLRNRPIRLLAVSTASIGALLHFISIAARIYILQRPPVGTLYESLLFVSLIAVLFGLFLEWRLRSNLGLLVAALSGSILLFASQTFSGDDTMSMLIAVLNTNFWLATHVLCITTGYGFGIVAGIIAHVYLIMRCLNRSPELLKQVLRGAYGTALIALLFTSLGTILGGIWADQSWGRFWGWDPKENGALVICLWLIWLLHSRISGHFSERGFAAGLALLNIVIALSWLGVNLLSTGLHSYGFTDKAAWALAAFCAAEIMFAGITYAIIWRRERAPLL